VNCHVGPCEVENQQGVGSFPVEEAAVTKSVRPFGRADDQRPLRAQVAGKGGVLVQSSGWGLAVRDTSVCGGLRDCGGGVHVGASLLLLLLDVALQCVLVRLRALAYCQAATRMCQFRRGKCGRGFGHGGLQTLTVGCEYFTADFPREIAT